jgi:DNA-directed RNA polymerase specialized sigma24 family protein
MADYDDEVSELGAIAGRDQEAFGRWLARHDIPMRLALRRLAHLVDVEAIVQETAIVVWQRAPTLVPDGRRGFLWRWAVTVALNRARNEARRNARRGSVGAMPDLDQVTDPHTAGPQPDPLFIARISHCRAQLPEKLARALAARIEDSGQRSDRQLAAALGVTFDAFRQSLARGRKALRQCLSTFGIDLTEYAR